MDTKTLIISNMLVCAVFGIAFFIYSSEQKTYRGFKLWNLSILIMTLGFLAIMFRGTKGVGVSIFAVNGFFTLAAVIRLDAIKRFLLNERQNKIFYSLPFLVALACILFYFLDDRIEIRTLITSSVLCLLSVLISWTLIRHSPPENRLLYYSAGVLITVRGLTVLTRAVFGYTPYQYLIFDESIWSSVQLEFGMICEILQNVFFLMMNSKRAELNFLQSELKLNTTVTDLKKAMSVVNRLQGILPICAHCKKIRDDQGAWQGIEKYVHERSEAQFSHGICPECAKIHYPEFDLSGKAG